MTLREFYLERRRAEVPVFLSVLRAVPTDHPRYKPHDRSPTAEQVVWTVTSELKAGLDGHSVQSRVEGGTFPTAA